MQNTILVLGGDGYYGWPISLKLAVTHPDCRIVIVDNEWRRQTVCKVGSDSLLPVARLPRRIAAFNEIYGQHNLHYQYLDVNSDALDELVRTERPHTIYHMAQQCSAPYSMLGLNESLYTIRNNEGNNMRLLWAVRRHVPEAHVIKLGSMGEYACTGGIDIAEGYFYPEFNGRRAATPLPFPRSSDDVYHISKINDSNYIAMACRKWGLRITEVMQSTLFGVYTAEMAGCEDLYTRFDYDDIFGTVVNRFLTQALSGHPLTVYGEGRQTTGIMAMKDAVNSLEKLLDEVPAPGVHRVINHVTQANCAINELAGYVRSLAGDLGYDVTISHVFDPRSESDAVKREFKVMTSHIDDHLAATPVNEVLCETFGLISRHRDRIRPHAFTHHIHAFRGEYVSASDAALNDAATEQHWNAFRERYFHTSRVNLNPGTLGTASQAVREARLSSLTASEVDGNPLGMYENGRKNLLAIKSLCSELWPSSGYELMVGNGTSQTMNLLALALLRAFNTTSKAPYRVITSLHEHPGGIGVFEQLPEYEVYYLDDEVLADSDRLRAAVLQIRPHVAFLSQVYYATGNFAPYENLCDVIKEVRPACKVILDVTQAIGLYELPFGKADLLLGSLHKWLFGPHGSGLTWMKESFRKWIGGLFWNGVGLVKEPEACRLSLQGGQDFLMYSEILAALRLYQEVGRDVALERSVRLAAVLRSKLEPLLTRYGLPYTILSAAHAPLLSVAFREFNPFDLYSELNENAVHCKCIIDHHEPGGTLNVLRFGLPYFESVARVEEAVAVLDVVLQHQQKVVSFDAAKPVEPLSKESTGSTVAA
jgi:UDP-sulfoquinovose synthase